MKISKVATLLLLTFPPVHQKNTQAKAAPKIREKLKAPPDQQKKSWGFYRILVNARHSFPTSSSRINSNERSMMIFDDLDFSKLPANREEAFTNFVKSINEEYAQNVQRDRNTYSDRNGDYEGSYEPERSFVTAILAFLDEYGIETEIVDISDLSNQEFASHFGKFKSKVEYLTTRFKLRQHRIGSGSIGTLIAIGSDYKIEIGKLLETARKIVNQEITDKNKKEKLFAKIASLQSEVDRDQTTVDALFGKMLDLTQTIGESAENLSPLIDKLERIKKLFWDKSKKVEQLPKPDRPKLITKEEPLKPNRNIDDEIPF